MPGSGSGRVWDLVNPLSTRQYVLRTRLGPRECEARLRERVIGRSLFGFSAPLRSGVWGSVSIDGFSIVKYTPWMRNSFRPVAAGRFVPDAQGTRILVLIGLQAWVTVFMLLWVGLTLASALVFLWAWGAGGGSLSGAEFPVVAVAMPVMGLAILVVGRVLSAGEDAYLLTFIRETLEAGDEHS